MRGWQRFVAAVFLMIFVPTNVVAALPLVYCVTAGGHRAIELVQSIPHHAAEHGMSRAPAPVDALHAAAAKSAGLGCLDLKIVPTGQIQQAASSAKVTLVGSLGSTPQACCLSCHATLLPRYPIQRHSTSAKGHRAPNHQLAALRTVVLLN